SARRATSSTCGSTRAAATRRCWRRVRSSGGRPSCTWRAPTSTAAGSSPRCSRRSGLATRRPTRPSSPTGSSSPAMGERCPRSPATVLPPDELRRKFGPGVRRLGVAAEDSTQDIRVSMEILARLADAYRRMRNTFRFLLGNLGDFAPARDRQSSARLDEVDRWVLDRLAPLIRRARRAYDEYEFHTVFHSVHNFCAVDLSALYLDIIKDRLYTSLPDDPRRRAAQTVCFDVFSALARLMAPILTFTTEEAWRHMPGVRSE